MYVCMYVYILINLTHFNFNFIHTQTYKYILLFLDSYIFSVSYTIGIFMSVYMFFFCFVTLVFLDKFNIVIDISILNFMHKDQRDGSEFKNTCLFFRELRFGSYHTPCN